MPENVSSQGERVGRFHAREGWYFRRLTGGSVEIVQEPKDKRSKPRRVRLDRDTWASVIASVSWRGETGDAFHEAEAFHGGGLTMEEFKALGPRILPADLWAKVEMYLPEAQAAAALGRRR